MLKLKLLILVATIVAVSCICPHALNKRRAGRGGGSSGGKDGPPQQGDNGGGPPKQGGNGGNGGGPGGNGGNGGGPGGNDGGEFRPDDNNDNEQPRPEDLNGPPKNNGRSDRRPRPTTPTEPAVLLTTCPVTRYSSLDGGCNNLEKHEWGRAQTSYKRYLDASYEEDNLPRRFAVNGEDLPNPRYISRYLMTDNSEFESTVSDILPYFGQWLAHDFSEIQEGQDENGFIDCPCGSTNDECLSFVKPAADHKVTQDCFPFIRSVHENDNNNERQQTNFLSSYIDGSQTYGKNEAITKTLRTDPDEFNDGKLKNSDYQNNDGRNYLPTDAALFCVKDCFVAGEDRPSENMALTSIQTLWLRNHNRLAEELKGEHKDWDDEELFQEARKINIATMQHIIYNEFLPVVIGDFADDLKPKADYNGKKHYDGYDSSVNPSLAQGFSVAAFRFGHSIIREDLDRFDYNHNDLNSPVTLGQLIFDTTEAYNDEGGINGLEKILMGLLAQPSAKLDHSIIDHLQNHLFEFADEEGNVFTFDLPAANINRGRDHGLPAYYKYVEYCSPKKIIENWSDLDDLMSTDNKKALKEIYTSPKDIDFFVGGLMETTGDALVGPTFSCIIRDQFRDLKNGDRFYYENGPDNSETAFSGNQVEEIKETTLAGLICENFPGVTTIQSKAFLIPGSDNPRVKCDTFEKLTIGKF